MSGGGGTQVVKNEIPEWVEGPAKDNLARAAQISQIGFAPYMGPDVAAFSGQQLQAMENTNALADAFGMGAQAVDVPQAQSFGGISGYSSYPVYNQARRELRDNMPGTYRGIMDQFTNPWSSESARALKKIPVQDGGGLFHPGESDGRPYNPFEWQAGL